MRESIGNTMLVNIILIVVGAVILILIGSVSYSKAFKVKNLIINIMEENKGDYDTAGPEIEESLKRVGYRINTENKKCKDRQGMSSIANTNNYYYCVYEYSSTKGSYYGVAAFMFFEVPGYGSITIPIYGETKVINVITEQ